MVQMKTGKSKAKKEVKKPTKPVVAAKEESSEEEEDEEEESDSEEEVKVVTKKATPKANNKKAKAVAKQESEEEDSDEEDDDSEEEETKAPSKTTKKAVSKKNAKAESSEDDDDDDDDEDDSDEEGEKKAKKNGTKEKVEDDEDDDDEDDDDDDDDEEEEEEEKEEMEVSKPDKKRKQNDDKTENAKKAKSDETVTMSFNNLPEGTDDNSFNKFLKSKGIQCISCRANYSRGRAFIDISVDDKGKAIGLNQVEWKGSELEVGEDAKRSQQAGGGVNMSDRDARTMFVRNLPYSATEEEISDLFENVEEVRILIDRQTGNSKGICFVQFDTPESLKTNMEKKDGVELQGRSLYVDYAGNKGGGGGGAGGDRRRSSGGGQEGKTLFVKGITEDMTQDSLLEYFEGATEARMPQDNGKNKFFAYIEFASADQAMKVYKSAKGGIETNDGNLMVDFAKDKRGGGDRGRGGGGFRGGRGRGGGFGGGRGYGGRGGGRGYGGRGGGRGGGFGGRGRGGYGGERGRKTTFNDSD